MVRGRSFRHCAYAEGSVAMLCFLSAGVVPTFPDWYEYGKSQPGNSRASKYTARGAGSNTALSYPSHIICSLPYQPGLICSY